MEKLPPIEKIAEAYTAIVDNRLEIHDNYAYCYSSNHSKKYEIRWDNNMYYSNDNSTYWQGYIGYPIISILFIRGILPLNNDILIYFKDVNWKDVNKKFKNNYKDSLSYVISNLSDNDKNFIYNELNNVYEFIKKLDITITRKKLNMN